MNTLTKCSTVFIMILMVFTTGSFQAAQNNNETTRVKKILRKVDDLWRGSSSHAINVMTVKTKHYTRTLRMESWSKGKEKSLIRILSPLKEKGVMTLKSGNSIYNYLPKTDRKIRLTSGMMMGSWMGSHFTNDDLVKESRLEEDYDTTISFEGKRKDKNIIEFTLIPKSDAAVVWGKLVLEVYSKSLIPIKQVYFDEDMKIVRTIYFTGLKLLAGRQRPSVMRVVPEDKPNEYTEFIYESLELNIDISEQFFSVSNLKRR
ncbi:MAG: outer membrane lipoprotein-sorting protein [Gammaproteobacteria bacterium]